MGKTKSTGERFVRIAIPLPMGTRRRIRRLAGPRGFSAFVRDAPAEELQRLEKRRRGCACGKSKRRSSGVCSLGTALPKAEALKSPQLGIVCTRCPTIQ